jgi:hypothetical protein
MDQLIFQTSPTVTLSTKENLGSGLSISYFKISIGSDTIDICSFIGTRFSVTSLLLWACGPISQCLCSKYQSCMTLLKCIKSDSVKLSSFLQKDAKKSPSSLRSLCGR